MAEFAVAVLDAYQHQGLGTVLLAVLFLRAEAVGIQRLRACVLPENLVVIRWLRALGAETLSTEEYLELELRTGRARCDKSGTPSRDKFDRLLAVIRQAAPAALGAAVGEAQDRQQGREDCDPRAASRLPAEVPEVQLEQDEGRAHVDRG